MDSLEGIMVAEALSWVLGRDIGAKGRKMVLKREQND